MSNFVTDKQIKDETDELFKECIEWALNFKDSFITEDLRTLAITRFLYLKDKVLNHAPKYYRDKELKEGKFGGTPIIQNE